MKETDSQDCCVTFKPKINYLEILLSAHAQMSQANILHLDQKAMKCTTVNGFVVGLALYSQTLTRKSLNF